MEKSSVNFIHLFDLTGAVVRFDSCQTACSRIFRNYSWLGVINVKQQNPSTISYILSEMSQIFSLNLLQVDSHYLAARSRV
jgi:hypothetical protein